MSEHDVEDLVEFSIRALDASARSALDIRDGIARLFAHQSQHDCSFTHFRLMELLLKRAHTYVVPVDKHPQYAAQRKWFDEVVKAKRFETVAGETDDEDADDEGRSGVEHGYLDEGTLYCDVDTPLWRTLVDNGTLPASPDVRELRLAEVVAWLLPSTDTDLVLGWYELGPAVLFADWFTAPVKAGEQIGIDPFEGEPIIAKTDHMRARPFTLDELRAVPEAIALREAGLAARASTPSPPAESEDEEDAAPMTEEAARMRAQWLARMEEQKRKHGEIIRIREWWDGKPAT
jgi:hypothetical protein